MPAFEEIRPIILDSCIEGTLSKLETKFCEDSMKLNLGWLGFEIRGRRTRATRASSSHDPSSEIL